MPEKYTGTIVEESLEDNRILNDFTITSVRISKADNPLDRWHLYTVSVSLEDIERLSENVKPKWYMHFWKGRKVVVIFQGKKFEFLYDDKVTWEPAVSYGLSLGIPAEQLDFPLE